MVLPCRVFADRAGIVEGMEKGELWRAMRCRPRADVGKRTWREVKDVVPDLSAAQHVEAHGSQRRVRQLGEDARAIAAWSAAVDLLAKACAETAPVAGSSRPSTRFQRG